MAEIVVTDRTLAVQLERSEHLYGLLRDITVPLDAISGVEVVPDALSATRGLRAPGLGLPGVRKIGTWRTFGDRQYVVVRRGQAALRISLQRQRYSTLLVGVDDPYALRERIDRARSSA